MAVSVIETIKSRANTGNTAYIVVVKLLCDDYSDLPTQLGLTGYELAQGCIAHVINENKDYMIDSSGNWHVYGGDSWTNVYTKSETDALLDELRSENDSQQSEIDYAVNTGVKNLCKITTPSATYGSLTFTVNDDGTISVDGSSGSTDKFFYLTTEEAGDDPQSYQNCILTGCPSGGSSSTYEILTTVNTVRDYGNGVLITSSNPTRIVIAIRKNQTVSNLVFKPMIRPASIVDSTFVPYAKTNCELTVVEDEDRAVLIEQVDNSAKNIANFTSTTKTVFDTSTSRGVTITRNGDIFTVSGTSDTHDNIFFNIYYEGSTTTKIIPPGNWVALIENYTGDVVKDIAIQIATPSTNPKVYGVPVQFSLSGSESGNWLRVNLRPSTTYNGSFRLMICTAADWAISQKFVPYCPSMQEMYQMILALQ